MCPPGYYCPIGSSSPVPCTPGNYCETSGLRIPTGPCSAGYYCNHSSSQRDQYVCPLGHYCLEGSGLPMPCPAGTYSDTIQNDQLTDCINCTGGKYCQGKKWLLRVCRVIALLWVLIWIYFDLCLYYSIIPWNNILHISFLGFVLINPWNQLILGCSVLSKALFCIDNSEFFISR